MILNGFQACREPSGHADKMSQMNPRRVRVSVPQYQITCGYVTCNKPATIQLALVDDEGNTSNVCQNLCDEHYELQVMQGEIDIVN
jgi:hypothetical protein